MFLRCRTGYTRDGEQTAAGPFLLVFSLSHITHPGANLRELRACVRHVRMHQFGHFMMGRADVGRYRISVSGTYGADGLPLDPDRHPGLWDRLVKLPDELCTKFWEGGGHNSCGVEGPDVHAWALENERLLRAVRG